MNFSKLWKKMNTEEILTGKTWRWYNTPATMT